MKTKTHTPETIGVCLKCDKPTPENELNINKCFSPSGFKPICDDCMDENQHDIDNEIDGRE